MELKEALYELIGLTEQMSDDCIDCLNEDNLETYMKAVRTYNRLPGHAYNAMGTVNKIMEYLESVKKNKAK